MISSVVESVSVTVPLDPWMGLKAMSVYSGLPIRALRAHLTDPTHPLPHFRMKEPHVIHEKGRLRTVTGKILIRKSEFDLWMQHFRHVAEKNVDAIVDSLLRECVERVKVGSQSTRRQGG
jgi:hypothetical protein